MIPIYVWPDGTWLDVCAYEENEYAFLGDDVLLLSVPDKWSDAEIDFHAWGCVNF